MGPMPGVGALAQPTSISLSAFHQLIAFGVCQESRGEDPFLSAQLTVPFVRGLQYHPLSNKQLLTTGELPEHSIATHHKHCHAKVLSDRMTVAANLSYCSNAQRFCGLQSRKLHIFQP